MKATVIKSVTQPAHNLTNQELIDHIEYEFPNLSGSLLALLVRFKEQYSEELNASDEHPNFNNTEEDNVVTCPICGTELQLSQDEDE